MKNIMGNAESRGKGVPEETLEKLHRRSGAKCEGSRLGFSCSVRLIDGSDPLVHHMDGNPRNNEMSNLVLLCPDCHLKVIDRLSERRRKAYLEKVAEQLDL
jgi:5-methylcytosine-specific restriction endonuclease McrA